MPPKKKSSSDGGISALLRDASHRAKLVSEQRQQVLEQELEEGLVLDPNGELVVDEARPFKPRIFNILEYIEQPWGLGMKLFPAQKFLVKLYYFLPLEERQKTITVTDMLATKTLYHFTEREYLQYLYNEGRCNIGEQDHERRELVLAIGRRAGKTTLSGIFASYEVYRLLNLHNPQKYYGLPNGNRIQIISVATDKDQASLLFNEVTSHLAKCEYFKPHVSNNTQSHILFRTPYDIEKYGPSSRLQNGKFVSFNGKATMRVTFRSSIAKGLRGAGNVVVILDEVAHFQDKGQSSAKDIYDSVTPSTAAFSPKDPNNSEKSIGPVESRIILISSPLNKAGKFYDQFHLAMSKGPGSDNILAIQAPTWEVNPTLPASYYKERFHQDPAVFMTEHGAQFSDRVRGWIEREVDLMDCVDPEYRPEIVGTPRYPHQMGIDIGLTNDGTAVAITRPQGDRIALVYHECWRAGVDWKESNPHLGDNYPTDYARTLAKADRLDFEAISDWIFALTKRFFITDGIFDQWNGIPLEQALRKKGLTQFRSELFQRDLSSRVYQNAKMLMFDRKLQLYEFPKPQGAKHSPLITELLNLQAQQVSKNLVIVSKPPTKGAADDESDALVRAIWLTSERMRNETHIYGASSGMTHNAGARMTAGRYQMMRARSHGISERMVPRNLGLGGRLANLNRTRGIR